MNEKDQCYEQYGEEWKKEMMKFPKKELVEMIKNLLTTGTMIPL